MVQKQMTERIAQLDPIHDHQEIVFLLTCYVFPWDIERALEFALFRTYAIPSISSLLARTGEFVKRPRKRYDDTELIMYELAEHGYDSDRGQRALQRMNQMHGRFPISNHDFLYVLSTFVFEPIRWLERYGWRSMTDNERLAWFHFYREVGKRMRIKDIPNHHDEFERFNLAYERDQFQFVPSNQTIGRSTSDLLLSFYFPKPLWPLMRPLVFAIMDAPLLDAIGLPHPSPILRRVVAGTLKLRANLVKQLPERNRPALGTQQKRPTYPEGYEIEELGTFPSKPSR